MPYIRSALMTMEINVAFFTNLKHLHYRANTQLKCYLNWWGEKYCQTFTGDFLWLSPDLVCTTNIIFHQIAVILGSLCQTGNDVWICMSKVLIRNTFTEKSCGNIIQLNKLFGYDPEFNEFHYCLKNWAESCFLKSLLLVK